MTSTDRQLTDDLRRLMPPANRPHLPDAQPRGALAGDRGYIEEAEVEAQGGGGGGPVQLTSSDGLFTIDIT